MSHGGGGTTPPRYFKADGLVSILIFPLALLRLLLLLYYYLFLNNLLHRYLSARNSMRLISLELFSYYRSSHRNAWLILDPWCVFYLHYNGEERFMHGIVQELLDFSSDSD